MDLNCLDKSSDVTPLLVNLYDAHKNYKNQVNDATVRIDLAKAVGNLVGAELSERETELIADVVIALFRQAELDLREALSERLAIMDNVPLRVVLEMANDDIRVAAPVLMESPVLGDMDLVYIIKSKSAEYWRAIAQRHEMSEKVVGALADTGDFETALTLVYNRSIVLSTSVLNTLSELARDSETLATPLLQRDEVDAELAGQLYRYVGESLKAYIAQAYDVDREALEQAVDEVVLEFSGEISEEFRPDAAMVKRAGQYKDTGMLTAELMIATLKRGQDQMFVAMLAEFADISMERVMEILHQPNGQCLAILCRAMRVMRSDFVSLFLLTNHFRSGTKTADTSYMTQAVQYFDQVKTETAQKIIRNSVSIH